jgi:TorA maturation chaperone TorD
MLMTANLEWRIQHYALLATLLAQAPEAALLEQLAQIDVSDSGSEMGKAWSSLKQAAAAANAEEVKHEYHTVFIGITQGEVVPYASFYRTGFLNEKPLAELRVDLAKLGLERQAETKEPEDHLAALFDVMRLILSAEGTPIVDGPRFFNQHIAPWAEKCCQDLSVCEAAEFYQSVANLALVFLQHERQENK